MGSPKLPTNLYFVFFRMDSEAIGNLLTAIRDAVSTPHQKDDDIALPVFDPDKNDCGAASWCTSIETLAAELKWSSIKTAAKAGKALRGSAITWFETWEPTGGRSWENFRTDITDAYPEKKNLSEKLSRAVLYNSDSSGSYGEYAREKIRLFRNTKISLTDEQLVELVCGGISDMDVRTAALNSGVITTAALISLLSIYVKTKKRPLDNSQPGPSGAKRPKFSGEKRCFACNQVGHLQSQCPKNKSTQISRLESSQASQMSKPNEFRPKVCTYCKKIGHTESVCFHKQRAESGSSTAITITPTSEANFLGRPN